MLFLTVETLTLSVLLLVVWLRSRRNVFYLYWSFGFAVRALGIMVMALRDQWNYPLPLELPNALTLWSITFWLAGLYNFSRRPIPPTVLLPVAIWLIGMQFPTARESLVLRAILYGTAMSGGYIMLARVSWSLGGGNRLHRQLLSALWGTLAVNTLVLVTAIIIEQPANVLKVSVGPACGAIGAACLIATVVLCARIVMDVSETGLRRLASSDPLTGALNRRGLVEGFRHLKEAAAPQTGLIALLLFDLDHFKEINDRCSHEAGDQVLTAFARLAQGIIAENGVFARSGGEEFIAVLRVDNAEDAVVTAEAVRTCFEASVLSTKVGDVFATVSVGIACIPAGNADIDELMHAADKALYQSKAAGRNCTSVNLAGEIVTLSSEPPGTTADHVGHGTESLRDGNVRAAPRLRLVKAV